MNFNVLKKIIKIAMQHLVFYYFEEGVHELFKIKQMILMYVIIFLLNKQSEKAAINY